MVKRAKINIFEIASRSVIYLE